MTDSTFTLERCGEQFAALSWRHRTQERYYVGSASEPAEDTPTAQRLAALSVPLARDLAPRMRSYEYALLDVLLDHTVPTLFLKGRVGSGKSTTTEFMLALSKLIDPRIEVLEFRLDEFEDMSTRKFWRTLVPQVIRLLCGGGRGADLTFAPGDLAERIPTDVVSRSVDNMFISSDYDGRALFESVLDVLSRRAAATNRVAVLWMDNIDRVGHGTQKHVIQLTNTVWRFENVRFVIPIRQATFLSYRRLFDPLLVREHVSPDLRQVFVNRVENFNAWVLEAQVDVHVRGRVAQILNDFCALSGDPNSPLHKYLLDVNRELVRGFLVGVQNFLGTSRDARRSEAQPRSAYTYVRQFYRGGSAHHTRFAGSIACNLFSARDESGEDFPLTKLRILRLLCESPRQHDMPSLADRAVQDFCRGHGDPDAAISDALRDMERDYCPLIDWTRSTGSGRNAAKVEQPGFVFLEMLGEKYLRAVSCSIDYMAGMLGELNVPHYSVPHDDWPLIDKLRAEWSFVELLCDREHADVCRYVDSSLYDPRLFHRAYHDGFIVPKIADGVLSAILKRYAFRSAAASREASLFLDHIENSAKRIAAAYIELRNISGLETPHSEDLFAEQLRGIDDRQ